MKGVAASVALGALDSRADACAGPPLNAAELALRTVGSMGRIAGEVGALHAHIGSE